MKVCLSNNKKIYFYKQHAILGDNLPLLFYLFCYHYQELQQMKKELLLSINYW